MERSWVKRALVAVVAFVMKLAGMKLKEDPSGPANEYSVGGPFRTPEPPAVPPPPVKVRPSAMSRLRVWLKSLRSNFKPMTVSSRAVVVTVTAAAVTASIWGIYWLIAREVPQTTEYVLSPGSSGWVIALPFAVSRWWDVAFFAVWAFSLARLIGSYTKSEHSFGEEPETISLVIGLIFAVLGTVITAICVGCGHPSNVPGQAEVPAVGTVMGAFAAGLIAPVACALFGSVIATIGAGLDAGLRTCWSVVLLGGLVAGIVFGAPGGLLYCFIAGGIITVFNVGLRVLISIGKDD